MRLRSLFLPSVIVCLAALAVAEWIFPGPVLADEAKAGDPNVWSVPRWGFTWRKPEDPEWAFIPEEKWKDMFTSGKPDNMVCALAKYTVPGGQWGKDNYKILFVVWEYPSDQKIKVGGKDIDCGNLKGMCQAINEVDAENWKDLKEVKKANVVEKYKFDKKVYSYSFTGINKQNGGTGFQQGLFFKGNSKYVFRIDIACPSANEKAVRHELDRVLNMIQTTKPEKD